MLFKFQHQVYLHFVKLSLVYPININEQTSVPDQQSPSPFMNSYSSFFGRWEKWGGAEGTPWDSERSVPTCQHTQLWSQAPAKHDEKGEPLSYQNQTGLLYIRLKSKMQTYLFDYSKLFLQSSAGDAEEILWHSCIAKSGWSGPELKGPCGAGEVPRQHDTLGAWAPERVLSPGPRPEAASPENHHPRAGSANGHPSFFPSTYRSSIKSKVVSPLI